MMDLSCTDENQLSSHVTCSHKRKLKRTRRPLADASVNANLATAPAPIINVETRNQYLEFLRSTSSETLYAALERDILLKAPVGASVDLLKALVTEYLKTDCKNPYPSSAETTSRKKRRTADQEIIETGFFSSPSPTRENKPIARRRSLRLRNSLSLPRISKGLLSDDSSVAVSVDKQEISKPYGDVKDASSLTVCYESPMCNNNTESESSRSCSESVPDLATGIHDRTLRTQEQWTESSDLQTVANTECLSDTECQPAEDYDTRFNTTFTIAESEENLMSDDDFIITPEIEKLYKSRGEFVMPSRKEFSTIYEEPKKCGRSHVTFSKTKAYRSFDFSDGCWYRVPQEKLRLRVNKAKKNGWLKLKNSSSLDEALETLLRQLDTEMGVPS